MSRDKEEIKKAFNQVRYRAGLPGLTANQLNSTPEVQKQIERERMVEFYGKTDVSMMSAAGVFMKRQSRNLSVE